MLLTVPWVAAMFLARVDIVKGKGVDGQCDKLKPSSFVTQVTLCFGIACENVLIQVPYVLNQYIMFPMNAHFISIAPIVCLS